MQLSSQANKGLAIGLAISMVLWSVSFLTIPLVFAAPHGDNCLINENGTVFLVNSGVKRGFTSAEVFASNGYNFGQVVAANSDDASLTTGSIMVYADGTLVKGPSDPLVYLVANGQKRGFVSGDVFTGLGYSFANIQSAPANTFADLPVGANMESATERHPAGTLVNSGGTIWKMTASGRMGVPSMDVFNSHGLNLAKVVVANSADLAATNDGLLAARGTCGSVTPPITTGDLMVSAGAKLASTTLPGGANNVSVMDLVFTGPASGTANISGITIKRTGVGVTGDIANAYIYDGNNRLTSGRTFNTSTNQTTFTLNVDVPANTVKTLSLRISLATSPTTGATHAFSVEVASSVAAGSTTVGGTFPIMSNTHTISGTAAGTVTLTKTGALSNPRVGDKQAKVTEFTLATATEDGRLSTLTLTQGGNIANSALSNFQLKQSGTVVATASAINANSRLDLVFNTGFTIDRGNSRVFELYADVGGRPNDTIIFYVEEAADLLATGLTFNSGMTSTVTNMDTTGEAHTLTLQGGQFTITFSGPSSRNISNTGNDISLWEGSLITANQVEVRNWRVRVQDTNATDPDLADTAATAAIQDVKIWDMDRGVVIAGPLEFTAAADLQDATLVMGDDVTLAAASTTNIKITADVKNTPASSTMVLLVGLAAFGANDIKNVDSNTFLTPATDIAPNSEVQGQNQTVTAGALTISTAPSPADHTIVKGNSNHPATAFNFAVGAGDRVKVTNISVTAGISDTDDNAYGAAGAADGGSPTVASLVQSAKLMTGGLQIGTTKSFSSGVAAFDNLNWWIEPSQTPKVEVVITTNSAATLSGNDFLRFSLEASSVTAVDTEGNTVTATGIPANSAEAGGDTVVTVAGAGTLNATLAPNPTNPSSGLLVAGASDQVFVAFKYDAINDSFLVKKLNLLPYVGGASSIASNDRINVLKVRYKNQAGTTVTSTVGLSATTNQVDISANPMYVAQNGNATLEVLGDLAQFTVLDGTEDENLTFANDADNTSTLNQATGVGSNSDVNSWGAADLVGNQQNIYRTVLSAAKGSGTPENTGRSRSSAQFVASWRFTASTNSNAFLRGSKKGIDGATTSWAANGVGAPATSTTAVSGTSSISHTEDGTSAVNDSFNFDFGASAGLENYNRLNFNLRSVAAKAVGDMGISVSSTADSTDDATLNGLGTVTVNNVDLSATLAAATWANQDFAGPFVATDRFVTFNIKANPDNSNAVLVDDLRFYNDSITPTVAGSLGTAATIGGLLMELKNSGGTTVAYGGYTGTAATGTTVLIAGDGADKTAITTYSDVEFTSTGASYDLQTNTTTLMAADTTANETLSVSVATGAVSSAGNFRWYDNSDTAGSNNQAGITVVAPTSTTLDFSNNY